jgi:hypothetical protein
VTVTNPLAPGVYRIDLPCELAAVFGNWRRAQKGRVQLLELDNGPGGRARVTFVVFQRPGAFPFGRLGKPVVGELVGAMPDWTDVVQIALVPLPALLLALEGKAMADFLAEHTTAEFAPLRDAIGIARANAAIIRMQLEAVKNGTSVNPAAALQNAANLVRQSTELIVHAGGSIPGQFARHVVNSALERLHDLGEAIASAPQKALAAVAKFPGLVLDNWLKPFVLPAEGALLGIALIAGGAYLAYEQKQTTPLTRNLMLAGGAIALLGGGVLASNVSNLIPRETPK